MKATISILFFLAFSSCTTIPKGRGVMKVDVKNEQERLASGDEVDEISFKKGRVIFIKCRRHVQVVTGEHIELGTDVLLKVGREDLNLNNIIGGSKAK